MAPLLHSKAASGVGITQSSGCSAGAGLVLPAQCPQHLLRTGGMWHLSASWDSWELKPRSQNLWTHIGNDHSPTRADPADLFMIKIQPVLECPSQLHTIQPQYRQTALFPGTGGS